MSVKRKRRGSFKASAGWRDLDVTRSSDGAESVLSTANSLYGDLKVGFSNYLDGSRGLTQLSYAAQPLQASGGCQQGVN